MLLYENENVPGLWYGIGWRGELILLGRHTVSELKRMLTTVDNDDEILTKLVSNLTDLTKLSEWFRYSKTTDECRNILTNELIFTLETMPEWYYNTVDPRYNRIMEQYEQ